MRNWLLTTLLFKWAYRQGGIDSFPLAQKDILDTMPDDLEKRAEELAQEKLQKLLSPVDHKYVITITKTGVVFIGGEKADAIRLNNLKSEALFFEESDLWKILNGTVRELAQRAMFVSGDKLEDLQKGRSVLYTLDSQNRVIDTLKSVIHKPEMTTISTTAV